MSPTQHLLRAARLRRWAASYRLRALLEQDPRERASLLSAAEAFDADADEADLLAGQRQEAACPP